MGKVLLCHLQPPREWAQRAAYLLIGLWVVPVLAQRAAGFRAVVGWKYGWGGGRERSVEPGERLGSSRREALAIHKALTPVSVFQHQACALLHLVKCVAWVSPPFRLRRVKVLEAESLTSDHTTDLGKAGILI